MTGLNWYPPFKRNGGFIWDNRCGFIWDQPKHPGTTLQKLEDELDQAENMIATAERNLATAKHRRDHLITKLKQLLEKH